MSPCSSSRRLAILGFHKIGEAAADAWGTWFYIPQEIFARQLTYLHDNGWQVIDLAAMLAGVTEPDTLPERAALITFDDGYRSTCDVALPWLLRFRYPAVVFVPCDYIGGYNSFDADNAPVEPLCDWEQLRELERCGVSVQSHGTSHTAFSELDPRQQEEELRRSKTVLEAGLGKGVEVFAFPYGDNGVNPQRTDSALRRAGYRAACLYGARVNRVNPVPVPNPYRLCRLAMGPDTDLRRVLA